MYLYDLWKGRAALSENMNAHILLYSVGDFMTAPQKFCIQLLGCCSFLGVSEGRGCKFLPLPM